MSEFSHRYARPDHPVLDEIVRRWSPYVFDGERVVEPHKLLSCLEAARWAASSYNEQPWRFMISTRDEPSLFQAALNCLSEANQVWARDAPVLIFTAYATTFRRNGKENRVALHDLGLAAAQFSLEATRQGLHVHQMAGIDLNLVRSTYEIPAEFQPATAIAMGYAKSNTTADDPQLAARDQGHRERQPLSEWVFAGRWGQTAPRVIFPPRP